VDIYFIFVSSANELSMLYSELIEALSFYPNVYFRYVYPKDFSKGTTMENFFTRDAIAKSKYPVEHLSDALRYLDLDIISLASISTIEYKNFACAERDGWISNAVLGFDHGEAAKEILNPYMEYNLNFFLNLAYQFFLGLLIKLMILMSMQKMVNYLFFLSLTVTIKKIYVHRPRSFDRKSFVIL
jgi:hypothetical protein